jgi:hypothetical protein
VKQTGCFIYLSQDMHEQICSNDELQFDSNDDREQESRWWSKVGAMGVVPAEMGWVGRARYRALCVVAPPRLNRGRICAFQKELVPATAPLFFQAAQGAKNKESDSLIRKRPTHTPEAKTTNKTGVFFALEKNTCPYRGSRQYI